jgi:hypothetical protein
LWIPRAADYGALTGMPNSWFAASLVESEPPAIEVSLFFGPPVDRGLERLPLHLAPWRPVEGRSVPTLVGESKDGRDERVALAIKADGYFLFRAAR